MERTGHPAEGGATVAERSFLAAVAQGVPWTPDFHAAWLKREGLEGPRAPEPEPEPDGRSLREAGDTGTVQAETRPPGPGDICADLLRALIVVEGALARGVPLPAEEAKVLAEHGAAPDTIANVRGVEISWPADIGAPVIRCASLGDHGPALDLRGVIFPKRLALEGCRFRSEDQTAANILLDEAEMKTIVLSASHFGWLKADQLRLTGDFDARNIQAGALDLSNSRIGGGLLLDQAALSGGFGPQVVNLAAARIDGMVHFRRRFSARGGIDLSAAILGGDLNCSTAELTVEGEGMALVADGAQIAGSVFLSSVFNEKKEIIAPFAAKGGVSFIGAKIGGVFACNGGRFSAGSSGVAIDLNRAEVAASVYLRHQFQSVGFIDLIDAQIGSVMDCSAAKMDGGTHPTALLASGVRIAESLVLTEGFEARGAVELGGAHIGRSLTCSEATITAIQAGRSLNCDGIVIRNSALLRKTPDGSGLVATGEVNFYGATIGGDFQVYGSTFIAGDQSPIDALKGPCALDLDSARIGGRLALAQWSNASDGKKRNHTRRRVKPPLVSVKGDLILANCSCSILEDWDVKPEKKAKSDWITGRIELDGFIYDRLGSTCPKSSKARKIWLMRQPPEDRRKEEFKPQPHEQLVKVLREMGHLSSARDIAVTKQWRMHWSGKLNFLTWLFRLLVLLPSGYGYRPQYPFLVGALAVVLAYGVFETAYRTGYMGPAQPHAVVADMAADIRRLEAARSGSDTEPPDLCNLEEATEILPPFNGLTYAIDAFVPLVDLDQETSWKPSKTRRWDDDSLTTRCLQQIADQNAPPRWWRWGWLRNPLSSMVRSSAPGDGLHWIKWSLIVLGFAISALIAASLSGLLRRD